MENQNQSKVTMCMQCGMCSGSCPESGMTPFNIRMLVRKNLLHRDIEASIPWYCTSCGECTLRCPRDVKPSEMIFELRAALVEGGDDEPYRRRYGHDLDIAGKHAASGYRREDDHGDEDAEGTPGYVQHAQYRNMLFHFSGHSFRGGGKCPQPRDL